MAQLKDLIVNGVSRFIGDIYGNLKGNADTATLATKTVGANISTTAYSLAYYRDTNGTFSNLSSVGSSGNVLSSGGTGVAPSWIEATNTNTVSSIVKRDANGNFDANKISISQLELRSIYNTTSSVPYILKAPTHTFNSPDGYQFELPERNGILATVGDIYDATEYQVTTNTAQTITGEKTLYNTHIDSEKVLFFDRTPLTEGTGADETTYMYNASLRIDTNNEANGLRFNVYKYNSAYSSLINSYAYCFDPTGVIWAKNVALDLTAKRLIYNDSSTDILTVSRHYVDNTKLAVNSTSQPTENLYVNGTSGLNGATYHKTGHIYFDGVASGSTSNTTQLVFRNNGTEAVALSATTSGKFIINPSTSSTTGQIALAPDGYSYFSNSLGVGTSATTGDTYNVLYIKHSSGTASRPIVSGTRNSSHLSISNQGIQAYNNATATLLYLNYQGGTLQIGQSSSTTCNTTLYGTLTAIGGVYAKSDSSSGGLFVRQNSTSVTTNYVHAYIEQTGTTSRGGIAQLEIGNNSNGLSTGTRVAGNAEGRISLYSAGVARHIIQGNNTGYDQTHYLPNYATSGTSNTWIAIGGAVDANDDTNNAGVGSVSTPVYMDTDGVLKPVGTKSVYYGVCSTAAATAQKAATCSAYTKTTPEDGDIVFVRFTKTNSAAAADLTLKFGSSTNAYSIQYQSTTSIAILPGAGYLIAGNTYRFQYDSTGNGRWIVMLNYNSNTNTLLRTYASATNTNVPLIAQSSAASTIAAWSTYTDTYKDWYGVIPNADNLRAKINLSTGRLTVPGGITATATSLTTALVRNISCGTATPSTLATGEIYLQYTT